MKSPSDDREEKSSIADVVCSWWARHNHANVRVVLPAFALLVPLLSALRAEPTPLVTLEQRVVGASLDVTPAKLAVPKGIAGSISAQVSGGVAVPAGAVIEATLRGPSFPARRLVGKPGEPLLLPPLPLVGDYSLDAIRLADAAGVTILEGSPSRVPVNVFDDILISRVTSRPLTLDEIQERGIVIDEKNFRAVEFEVGFVLDGKTIPVKFPVVAPVFSQSTEIIPAAELEARLQQADQINRELSLGAKLPKELEGKQLNFEVQGINFQFVDPDEVDLALRIPPIPALLVVPGNVGFLHQFFSVMVFTENGAPESSSLTVRDLQAQLTLPPGPDQLPGTYDQPGDDPLRPARVGSNGQIFTKLPVVQPGPDGKLGTPDDDPRLAPHETGQAEFLVEGLQEGLHVMDLKLTALLDGLAAGPVAIEGRAAGSVLVRNPKFSLAFSHPRTVRASEPYDAFVTILNTSSVPANLVNVTLREASISGGTLAPGSPETVQLGTLLPGESATAKFRIISQRTGAITFSNLTTSDDSLVGRFRLRAGVDERGIALSPNTLLLPDFVNDLPATVRDTANRVLGQALSVATAGQLPPGILGVSRSFITAKALELAEAGQRVRYLDPLASVLPDLLLDWQGGRASSPGFDQIMRTTEAGDAFRAALFTAIEGADVPAPATAVDRLAARAADFAGRSEPWFIAASDANDFAIRAVTGDQVASFDDSTLEQALGYRGARGGWLATAAAPARFEWETASDFQRTSATIELLRVLPNGSAQKLVWQIAQPAAHACYVYAVSETGIELAVDLNCDGTVDSILPGNLTTVLEAPPSLKAVFQDRTVLSGRPIKRCPVPEFGNYATVLAVLFSKPMSQETINVPSAYQLDNGTLAGSVQIQPGGRVALLNMRAPVGALKPRSMTITGITDSRGNAIQNATRPVLTTVTEGVAIRGRVARADGTSPAGIPVTLTYQDEEDSGLAGCVPISVRVSQVFTEADGSFAFDFVVAGIRYVISATDTSSLSPEALSVILESISGDEFNRAKLEELANSASVQNTLLASFAVGALPQAIAKAEGLDRALLRDFVEEDSARIGTEVIVALRFRGRGTVTGRVLASDSTTPVPRAAVNLFPDPTTRELGRGVFSDDDGRFQFNGVPLGTFSIEATAGDGRARIISDTIDAPGATRDIAIVLSSSAPVLTELQGQVVEGSGLPHAGAQVFVGRIIDGKFTNIVSAATTNGDGFFTATGIPVGTYDVVAISADGNRKGQRLNIAAITGEATQLTITLQGFGIVTGRVELANGAPVANAIVAGGEALVRTAPDGTFLLTGVPTGQRTLEAGIEAIPALNIDFPRLGSATIDVLPGVQNFALIRLRPAGSIAGQVRDANGNPVPNVVVALPELGGFSYVKADENGRYRFFNLAIAQDYVVSAPAPLTGPGDNSDALIQQIQSGDQDKVLAAIGEAFATFTGVNDPLLNGEGLNFNPLTWGFNRVRINEDGQTVTADIEFLKQGTISGTVKNGQGVPIGARVRLTGIGPLRNGGVGTVIRGERNSDPAIGTFEFPGEALVGPFGLQAASPFFGQVITLAGQTSKDNPDASGLVLQFPSDDDNKGRLKGRVFNPDGSPAGADIEVSISSGNIIRTIADGTFDTQQKLIAVGERGPGVGYTVEAHDLITGLRGQSTVIVMPGIDNFVNVRLLGIGAVTVEVHKADGSLVQGAMVEMQGGAFPREQFDPLPTGADGRVTFENVFEGPYAVCASLVSGPTTIVGRNSVNITPGTTANVVVTLSPTAAITGIYLAGDRVTPIGFAQIAVGDLGYTASRVDGTFDIAGIPLGTYRLVSSDPVSGHVASLTVTLNAANEVRRVELIETPAGEIFGNVINGFGTGTVPNATVTLAHSDPFVGQRTVTTGPDGSFRFPGTPAGGLTLRAKDPATGFEGIASVTLPPTAVRFEANVQLQQLATLVVTVKEPNGALATKANVRIEGANISQGVDTNALGVARFTSLPLGAYQVRAESRVDGFTRRAASTTRTLAVIGATDAFELTLGGVGSVTGTVFSNTGAPLPSAAVRLTLQSPLFPQVEETTLTNPQGVYTFTNVPVGDFRLVVENQALGASANGTIPSDGAQVAQDLTLSASGSVTGKVVRANGSTPAGGIDVLFFFTSQSTLPGRALVRTDSNGNFSATMIPVGAFNLEASAPQVGGLARRAGTLTSNGQTLDLGNVVLDEDFPSVVSVTPIDTAATVPTTTVIELLFSEALNPARIDPKAIFVRKVGGSGVPASVQLLAPAGESALRLVRITPDAPLESKTDYQVVVTDGDRLDVFGTIIARGPIDLVDRPLLRAFIASFTTRDDTPPAIVSFTPEDGLVQAATNSVVRLQFDESIQSGASIILQGPSGLVAGSTALGVGGLVLVFVPQFELPPNTTFTAIVSGVRDLAGNLAAGQPLTHTFSTLDTVGPTIAQLRIKNNQAPIGNSTVILQAILAQPEAGARVRFTADFAPLSTVGPDIFELPFALPASGSKTIRAVAIDTFNNEGPVKELPVVIVPNQPPAIAFQQLLPATGPALSGSNFQVRVTATDDGAVTVLRAAATGAAVRPVQVTSGVPINVSTLVPSNAVPGSIITILAQATDNSGTTTEEQHFDLPVADGTPPVLTIVSPGANEFVTPPTFTLQTQSSDNGGTHRLDVTLTGAFTGARTRQVDVAPNTSSTSNFDFDVSNAPPEGGQFTATVVATDAVDRTTTVIRTFFLPDRRPPRLASIAPPDASLQRSPWLPFWDLTFDEPISGETLIPNLSVRTGGDVPVQFSLQLLSAQTVRVLPQLPLAPGTIYRLIARPGITDLAGNPWKDIGGVDVPASGRVFQITTAAITEVLPAPATKIVPGQRITARVTYESGFNASDFTFAFGNGTPVVVGAGGTQTQTPIDLPTNATQAQLNIVARQNGQPNLLLPAINLDLRPRNADDDGDGWLNGFEADRGMNPFVANLDSEDFDNDGLTNGQERARGTDPGDNDSDDDTLLDGAEVAANTNPLDADSDHDNLRDDVDPFPNAVNVAPVANPDTFFIAFGESHTIQITTELLANDTDPENQTLAVASFTQPSNGAVTQPTSGTLLFVPAQGFTGSTNFNYTARDPGGLTSTATVTFNVGTNARPVAGDLVPYQSGGLVFDGNDDSASGPLLANITNNFTIEFWARPDRNRLTFGEFNSGASAQSVGEFANFPTHGDNFGPASNSIHAGAGVSVGRNGVTVVEHAANYFPAPLEFNTNIADWTHVAVAYENGRPSLFINGAFVRLGLQSARTQIHPGTELSTSLGHFKGQLDEFRIWNRTRTPQEITRTFQRRLTGAEQGLAVYWRMDESSGTTLGSNEPAARTGTLFNGTGRIVPAAPLNFFGVRAVVAQNSDLILVLPGSDPDGSALTARILSLPAHGTLFQLAGTSAGAPITGVPANVTDLGRRVVYRPDNAFLGGDTFAFSMFDGGLESDAAEAELQIVSAFSPASDDVWDVSTGVIVTSSSGMHPQSSGENMFGATGGVEGPNALFADGRPVNSVHTIEWESPSFLRVEGARIFAADDGASSGQGGNDQRGFTEMRIFGRLNPTDPFTLLGTFRPPAIPYIGPVRTEIAFNPFVGKQFRAEFDQASSSFFGGPRIEELDGIGETVVFTPSATGSPIALQNATATLTQGGFPPGATIDGNTSSGGWAINAGPTPQTLVWETASDVAATIDTEFIFNFIQNFGGAHFLGAFRISATTDARSEFADGADNGGDVTANWTVLEPTTITSTGGETFTVRADNAIVVTGNMPSTTTYTIRFKGISGNVTGFRLETLNDASLGGVGGPGRTGHGNFVLTEVTAAKAFLIGNRAPRTNPDSGETTTGFSFTTVNVLANDSDPEGDAFSVFDFTQPPSGTGSVVHNGDGTFVFTPGAGFVGTTSFTYRSTDTFQNSAPGIVTVTVRPSAERIWINTAGGNWSNPANWLNGLLPGPDDIAVIEAAGNYTVSLDTTVVVSQLRLGAATGTQTLDINGQTLTVRHVATSANGGVWQMNAGRMFFGRAATFRSFIINGGGFGGAGDITFAAGGSWVTATALGPGRVIVPAGQTLTVNNIGLDGGCVLENRGTVLWVDNNIDINRTASGGSGRIENLAGAVWEMNSGNSLAITASGFSDVNGAPFPSFTNAGTIRKTTTSSTWTFSVPFTNTGALELTNGAFTFNAGGTNTGTMTGAAGTFLQFRGGTFVNELGAVVNAAGGVFQDAGDVTFNAPITGGATLDFRGGTMRFNAAQTFPFVDISGGFLTGAADVTFLSGSWVTATISGPARVIVPVGSTLTVNNIGLDAGRVFENRGTVLWVDNNIDLNRTASGGSGRIENLAGAVWEMNSGNSLAITASGFSDVNAAPFPSFTNAGTIRKTTTSSTWTFSVPFTNTGALELTNGAFTFNAGGTNTGPMTGAAGTFLQFRGGTFVNELGAVVNTAGVVFQDAGDVTFNAPITGGATLDFRGGTMRFNAAQTFPIVSISGGNLAGTGDLTFETGSWVTATISGPRRVIVPEGATVTVNNIGLDAGCVLENHGTVLWVDNNIDLNRTASGGSGRIENTATGVWEMRSPNSLSIGASGFSDVNGAPFPSFTNLGTVRKTTHPSTWTFSVPLINGSVVETTAGTILYNGGGVNTGVLLTQPNTAQQFNATFTLADGGTTDGTGLYILSAGTLTLEGLYTMANVSITGGTIAGAGDLTLLGGSWTTATMTGSGRTIVAPSATLTIDNIGLDADRLLENHGTVLWVANNIELNRTSGGGSGRIVNAIDGVWEVRSNNNVSLFASGFSDVNAAPFPTFTNDGIVRKKTAASTWFLQVPCTSTGSIEVETGLLRFDSSFTQTDGALSLLGGNIFTSTPLLIQGGTVDGAGTITGSLNNVGGTVSPNNTATINVTGGYSQGAAGRLMIELGGTNPGAFDVLDVGGSVTLAGTLEISTANGFLLSNNQSFPVLRYNVRTGDFDTTTGLTQGGVTLAKNFSANALTLATPSAGGSPAALVSFSEKDDASADHDGDGLSDAAERTAGTDPSNALSTLTIRQVNRSGANVQIVFASSRGRTCIIEESETMRPDSWRPIGPGVLGTGDNMMLVDKKGAQAARRFYRLRVATVTGLPAGFIQLELSHERRPISSPFDRAPVAAGRISSVGSNSFADASANWASDRWTGGGYIARIHTKQGWIDLSITGNSSNEVHTTVRAKSLRDLVQPGDPYEVASVPTLQELFAPTLTDLGASSRAKSAKTNELTPRVQISRASANAPAGADRLEPITHDGRSWRAYDGTIPDNNFPIAPGDGVLVTRFPTARLWLAGDVHLPRHPSELTLRTESFSGTHTPFDMALRDLPVTSASFDWHQSRRVQTADLLRVWSRDRFLIHFFDGSHWRRAGSTIFRDDQLLPAASAFFVDRQ